MPLSILPSGNYGAEMTTTCAIEPQQGGDFGKLQAYEMDQAKVRGTVNAGPTDETFEGMPSKYVDFTLQLKDKKFSVDVRSDLHLATDLASRFVSSSKSKDVRGTGYGEYAKRINTRIVATKTAQAGQDQVAFTVYAEFVKPWYVPEWMMLDEANKRGPGIFADGALKLAREMAQNY